jgi:hypothetical protein
MRSFHSVTIGVLAATVLAGCGQVSSPTATLVTTPLAAVTQAAPAEPAVVTEVVSDTVTPTVTLSHFAPGQEIGGTDVPKSVSDAMKATTAIAAPVNVRRETGTSNAANILDPWRPYGLGVSMATHDSVTLTWRTDLNSRAVIYFAKTWGISYTGYTQVYPENNNATFHQVTIGGLSRFRKYRFMVVGLAPLGMQFPSYPLDFRTKLF